ncbi:MAG: PIN domain-containing protein [Synergistaceae bacterium]|jgi:predicted nucleic acid-binding protein|nr:PIN domain-containing protein [Synergistaceae bacterium]
MKKLKIYLDTSIISHLNAPDVPDREADTKKLWEKIRTGEFEVFISPVVMEELTRCSEPKRSFLLEQLRLIDHVVLRRTDEVLSLASQYIAMSVLRQKSFDDCQHVAYACVYGCDMVVSWNFNHLDNAKPIAGVKRVNALAGYEEMLIYPPNMLTGGDENEI